jgi:hypothetical protein
LLRPTPKRGNSSIAAHGGVNVVAGCFAYARQWFYRGGISGFKSQPAIQARLRARNELSYPIDRQFQFRRLLIGASVGCGVAKSSRQARGRGKHKPNWDSNRYSSRLHRKPGCLPRRRSRLAPPLRLHIQDQSPHLAPCRYLTENLGVSAISGMRGGTLPVYENSTTSHGSDEHRRLQAAMATQSLMSCPRLSEQGDGRIAD